MGNMLNIYEWIVNRKPLRNEGDFMGIKRIVSIDFFILHDNSNACLLYDYIISFRSSKR